MALAILVALTLQDPGLPVRARACIAASAAMVLPAGLLIAACAVILALAGMHRLAVGSALPGYRLFALGVRFGAPSACAWRSRWPLIMASRATRLARARTAGCLRGCGC